MLCGDGWCFSARLSRESMLCGDRWRFLARLSRNRWVLGDGGCFSACLSRIKWVSGDGWQSVRRFSSAKRGGPGDTGALPQTLPLRPAITPAYPHGRTVYAIACRRLSALGWSERSERNFPKALLSSAPPIYPRSALSGPPIGPLSAKTPGKCC